MRPVSFELAGLRDRFLFSDAFVVDDAYAGPRLVFVSTYYPDVGFDFAEALVTLDGVQLNLFDEIGRDEHEPMRAIVYGLGQLPVRAAHTLEVRFRGQTLSARLTPERPSGKTAFALATLFKDDWQTIETCYHHYKQQGVDRFYLFYNGLISKLSRPLFSAPEIVYGEWDFRYWLHDPTKKQHHAQAMFLTMARFRLLPQCTYLALVDLDEFLAVPGEPGVTVREHVENVDAETLTARMYWAEVRRPQSQRPRAASAPALDLNPADLSHVWANPRHEGDARMKTIYRNDFSGLCGVHKPKPPTDTEVSEALALYHLVNTVHGRHNQITPDATPVSLL